MKQYIGISTLTLEKVTKPEPNQAPAIIKKGPKTGLFCLEMGKK